MTIKRHIAEKSLPAAEMPAFNVVFQLQVDGAFQQQLLKSRQKLEALGGTIDMEADELTVTYSADACEPGSREKMTAFIDAMFVIVPPQHRLYAGFYFNDAMDLNPDSLHSPEHLIDRDIQKTRLTISTNGEPVRGFSSDFPNGSSMGLRIERNENADRLRYDVIGECQLYHDDIPASGQPAQLTIETTRDMMDVIFQLRNGTVAALTTAQSAVARLGKKDEPPRIGLL